MNIVAGNRSEHDVYRYMREQFVKKNWPKSNLKVTWIGYCMNAYSYLSDLECFLLIKNRFGIKSEYDSRKVCFNCGKIGIDDAHEINC